MRALPILLSAVLSFWSASLFATENTSIQPEQDVKIPYQYVEASFQDYYNTMIIHLYCIRMNRITSFIPIPPR